MLQGSSRTPLLMVVFVLVFALFLVGSVVVETAAASGTGVPSTGIGARALGMGDAFVAVADDETAVYWNPAGITQIKHFALVPALSLYTDDWVSVLEAGKAVAAGQPPTLTNRRLDPAGLIGIVTSRFAVSEMVLAGSVANILGDGTASLSGAGEADTIITAAVPFAIPAVKQGSVAIGVNAKFVQTYEGSVAYNLGTGNLSDNSVKGSGMGFDAGILLRLGEYLQVGVTGRDVYTNVPGRALRLDGGVAATIPFLGTRLAASVRNFSPGSETFTVHVGAEQSLLGIVAGRIGAYRDSSGTGPLWYTAGAGIALGPLVIDAAVASDDRLASHARVAVSAGLRF